MPWTCPTCSIEINDDQSCPQCSVGKSSWTLVPGKTRAIVISASRTKLECRVGTETRHLPADDPGSFGYQTVLAEVCPALSKTELLALVERGESPAPASRLVARLYPRKAKERDVTLTVEFEQEDVEEYEFAQDDTAVNEDGYFDVQFLHVFGPEDVSELVLDGIHVIDVSEPTDNGHAPEIEVSALLKTVALPLRAKVRTVQLLEVEDIAFYPGRELLLPGGWSYSDDVTGLAVIGAALEHARHNPGQRLLVAGHTDTVGSESSNVKLSADRAQNVYLYLSGQREAWAAHCMEHFEIEDVQSVLKWIAFAHGWETDPGEVDGRWGSNSKKARDAFRARYGLEVGVELESGKQRQADWEAFYDLYERALAEKLKAADVSKVVALRETLRFTEPSTLACGESWPSYSKGQDNLFVAENRRVDVLFFDEDELPILDVSPAGASIYEEGAFQREYLDVDDALKDPGDAPYAEAPFSKDCPVKKTHPTSDDQAA